MGHLADSDNHTNTIFLQVNIDGLPLFHSSCKQFWPILGRVCSPVESDPFVIGLFCGEKKPENLGAFLQDFVSDMLDLQQGPVHIAAICRPVDVKLACFVCDAPARAFVKQVKGHSGYYGCEKCTQKGQWDGKVIFPDVNAPLRTDVLFDDMRYANHKTGQSPLQTLSVGMISQFPLDYMHLVCLGVMRRLLWFWTKSPFSAGIRISPNATRHISENLLHLKNFIPREFSRKCRSLNELDRWKATEFRQFLLYTGMVALKGHLSAIQYKHFLLLFIAMFCLASPDFYFTHADYAHSLLCLFVQHAGRLYSQGFLVYNVHGLTHSCRCEIVWPLDCYSAFPFENFLGQLKRLVRKPHLPLQQVVRRLSERVQLGLPLKHHDHCVANDQPKKAHLHGPVPRGCDWKHQFRQIYHKGLFFSSADEKNKCEDWPCVFFDSQYSYLEKF